MLAILQYNTRKQEHPKPLFIGKIFCGSTGMALSLPCASFMWFDCQAAPNEPACVSLVIGTSILSGDTRFKRLIQVWVKREGVTFRCSDVSCFSPFPWLCKLVGEFGCWILPKCLWNAKRLGHLHGNCWGPSEWSLGHWGSYPKDMKPWTIISYGMQFSFKCDLSFWYEIRVNVTPLSVWYVTDT